MVPPDPATATATDTDTAIVVDGHVHVHACFDRRLFFDAAARLHEVRTPFDDATRACVLLLTEGASEHWFDDATTRLAERGDGQSVADGSAFRLHPTAEDESIRVTDGKRALSVVAGCQIASSDGLEVLLLGSRKRVPDGLTMHETLERALAAGGLCAIPWGVGKWWGRRGRLLRELIDEFGERGLFLGDESGRPWFWPRPALLADAPVRDLPGTDPLPFASEAGKVGRMGFALRGAWDDQRPAASLKRALAATLEQPFRFATLESVVPFFFNQIRMQLRKRG